MRLDQKSRRGFISIAQDLGYGVDVIEKLKTISNAAEARQILSKARNKEMDIETRLKADAYIEEHDRKKKIVIEEDTCFKRSK